VNGWTGEDCNINIDDCAENPCYYGASCVDGVATVTCLCPYGKTGALYLEIILLQESRNEWFEVDLNLSIKTKE